MSWPLASHFSAILQHPRAAFRDPLLQSCHVEKDALGQPRPWSGAFAVVYKGVPPDGRPPLAIRVFTTESRERHERYDAISDYFRALAQKPLAHAQLAADAVAPTSLEAGLGPLPQTCRCLVRFEYRDAGIRSASDGKWYPLILMDWVEGDTLFQWVRARCQARDQKALDRAAQSWVRVLRELSEAQIAHGDLQPGNVMITPAGAIKLVDYDGMAVPALFGRRNLEVGVEPYQHPQRTAATLLNPHLDHYSALVIYVALRALAADPGLWAKYVEGPAQDRLLFRKEDLCSPAGSPLCYDLKRSPDGEVPQLLDRLLELTAIPPEQTPPLWQLTDGYTKVEELLHQQEWKEAVRLLNRRGRFRDAPQHLRPWIKQAYENVCREEAWQRLEAVPREVCEDCDRQLIAAWNEAVFAGYAAAEAQRARLAAARQRVRVLDHLAEVAAADVPDTVNSDRERLLADWAHRLPVGYSYRLQSRVALAVERLQALARLETALQDPVNELALAGLWQEAAQLGCEGLVAHPQRTRIELAQKRVPLLQELADLPETLPADQLDRRLLALWQPELLAHCAQAQPWQTAWELAVYRKELLARLQRAVEAGNSQAILHAISDPCMDNYPLPTAWNSAVRAARDRMDRAAALVNALQQDRREGFLAAFDVRLIRQFPERFENYRRRLLEWVETEVLPLEGLGLGAAVGRESLVRLEEPAGAYRLRWTWPLARFCDECLVAVCPKAPGTQSDPLSLPVLHRLATDRRAWESGGGSRVLHTEPDWHDCWVVVWARVDLGFECRFSHPLLLGRLQCRRGLGGLLSRLRPGTRRAADRSPADRPPDGGPANG